MRRAAIERARALRVWRSHLRLIHPDPEPFLCICENQPGRFRKTERIGGCGRGRWCDCNGPKLQKMPKRQERAANISYHEWLDELRSNFPHRKRRYFD